MSVDVESTCKEKKESQKAKKHELPGTSNFKRHGGKEDKDKE
jgi:hypothetical protein